MPAPRPAHAIHLPPHQIDPTLDPSLRSWVPSANDPATDFPVQHLPWCVFVHPSEGHGCVGVRIGDKVLDLGLLHEAGVVGAVDDDQPSELDPPPPPPSPRTRPHEDEDGEDDDDADPHHHESHHDHELCDALEAPLLNPLLALPASKRALIRAQVQRFLIEGSPTATGGQRARRLREKALFDVARVEFVPPAMIANYTDFYAGIHHATNVGTMFRPDNPLLPNYKHVPIGYHGRASSIVVSGEPIRRPKGQQAPPEGQPGAVPSFGPSTMLDYELEVGVFIAQGNELGEPVSIARAHELIAGLCLVNDWSARDVQKWEYQPLGPFLAKNFATTISPYIVPIEAMLPFRCPATPRPAGDPTPLPYLFDEDDQHAGGFDITLEVLLATRTMRERRMPPVRISQGSLRDMYWTFAQLIAHHTSNGCNLLPGDLLASGTISGKDKSSRGCLLELTWDGLDDNKKPKPRTPLELPTGEKRTFLQDGDQVIFRAGCQREGYRRIGFGECAGIIEG